MGILNFQYYDHPEGHDVFGKMMATNKYAAATGIVWSTYEVLMIRKPQGYFQTLGHYFYWTAPLMGMATAFTLTTYAATNLRGKDDTWNYVLGACSSGAILGAWKRNAVAGCYAALIFSVAGAVKKLSKIEGWEFFPEFGPRGIGNATSARNWDWTLMHDPPKNWTTGKD